jgi:hypothetical protein
LWLARWPDWANFCLLGDCFLWTFFLTSKVSKSRYKLPSCPT